FDLTDISQRFAFLFEVGSRKTQQPNPGFGGLRRLTSAQQTGAQAVFQICDGLADRRLRKIQALRGPAETARLDHRVEAAQFVTFNLHSRRITDQAAVSLSPLAALSI